MPSVSAKYQFIMVLQILIILYIFSITPSLASPLPPPEVAAAKPGCVDHCGNISIPYPFGTTPECYQDHSFWVTCSESDVSKPPKLFSGNGSLEMTSISLEGQVRYLQYIAHDCYNRDGNRSNNSPWVRVPRYFTVNNTANMFTIVGCDAYAYVYGRRLGRNYTTGCTAMCYSKDELTPGPCRGIGCCQTPIPGNVSLVEVQLRSYSNYSAVWDFNNCGYAFLVEDAAFKFSPDNLTNLRSVERLPIVADWAIGNVSCEEAQTNSSSYACVSPNSGCYKPENGYGYRCRCSEGYRVLCPNIPFNQNMKLPTADQRTDPRPTTRLRPHGLPAPWPPPVPRSTMPPGPPWPHVLLASRSSSIRDLPSPWLPTTP